MPRQEVTTMEPLNVWLAVVAGMTAVGYIWLYWHKAKRKKAKRKP